MTSVKIITKWKDSFLKELILLMKKWIFGEHFDSLKPEKVKNAMKNIEGLKVHAVVVWDSEPD